MSSIGFYPVCTCGHEHDKHRDAGDPRGPGCHLCDCSSYEPVPRGSRRPAPIEVELQAVELPALVLRDFDWRLRPQYDRDGTVRGIALDLQAKAGLPLQLTAMFDRSEFVSLATTGLAGLDAADAGDAGPSEGRG